MNTSQLPVSTAIPIVSPQPISRRKALPAHGLLSAHVMAGFKEHGFHLSISGHTPELLSSNEKIRVPLDALTLTQLQAIKNLAHDQYVRAMLESSLELDTHRATLNFLSRQVQKLSDTPATRASSEKRRTRRPSRNALRGTTKTTTKPATTGQAA